MRRPGKTVTIPPKLPRRRSQCQRPHEQPAAMGWSSSAHTPRVPSLSATVWPSPSFSVNVCLCPQLGCSPRPVTALSAEAELLLLADPLRPPSPGLAASSPRGDLLPGPQAGAGFVSVCTRPSRRPPSPSVPLHLFPRPPLSSGGSSHPSASPPPSLSTSDRSFLWPSPPWSICRTLRPTWSWAVHYHRPFCRIPRAPAKYLDRWSQVPGEWLPQVPGGCRGGKAPHREAGVLLF